MRRLPLTRCTVLARPRKGRSTTISDLCAASGGLGEWPLYDVQHALVKRGWGTAIAAKRVMRYVEQHSRKYRVSSYVSLSTRQPLKPIVKLFDCPSPPAHDQ
jgi:hypothetical protein